MDDLRMLIASDEPDIMLFTEVIPKAQKNPIFESQLEIKGYELFKNFNNTDTNLGSSGIRGVAIYVKDNLNCKEIELNSVFWDHVWVEISLKRGDKLLCGCIYRSPTKEKAAIMESTKKVGEVISEAAERNYSHLLICGDFNYPNIDWDYEYIEESTNIISPFIETVQKNFLHQHVLEATRFREGEEPGLLDLVFSNEKGMVYNLTHNAGLGESDHTCIDFTLDCYQENKQLLDIPNFFKADYKTIRKRLAKVNWISELEGDFITAYCNFSYILEKSMEGCIPKFNIGQKNNLYLNHDAIRKKNLKNKLWRRFTRTQTNYDRKRYTQVKNELRSLTRMLRL